MQATDGFIAKVGLRGFENHFPKQLGRAGADQHLAGADEAVGALEGPQRLLDLAPDRLALGIGQTGHHLMQRTEGFALEAHALGGAAAASPATGHARTSMSRKPALASVASSTPSPPSENGPGWPGSGAGRRARSRISLTGSEKKPFFSGVE